jgi:hypothetical protein
MTRIQSNHPDENPLLTRTTITINDLALSIESTHPYRCTSPLHPFIIFPTTPIPIGLLPFTPWRQTSSIMISHPPLVPHFQGHATHTNSTLVYSPFEFVMHTLVAQNHLNPDDTSVSCIYKIGSLIMAPLVACHPSILTYKAMLNIQMQLLRLQMAF